VASFAPNQYGLYDMHGNVQEWVEDCYADSYWGASSSGAAQTGGDCSRRVLRGGSWFDSGGGVRSAARRLHPGGKYEHSWVGFRIAMDLGSFRRPVHMPSSPNPKKTTKAPVSKPAKSAPVTEEAPFDILDL
jgi:hypothetical protein